MCVTGTTTIDYYMAALMQTLCAGKLLQTTNSVHNLHRCTMVPNKYRFSPVDFPTERSSSKVGSFGGKLCELLVVGIVLVSFNHPSTKSGLRL